MILRVILFLRMKKEILRERQIMHNAAMISEKKEISTDIANTQKNNIKTYYKMFND